MTVDLFLLVPEGLQNREAQALGSEAQLSRFMLHGYSVISGHGKAPALVIPEGSEVGAGEALGISGVQAGDPPPP